MYRGGGEMLQADGIAALRQGRAGEHGQGEDIQMIGVERQGKVQAGGETLQGVARQAVDQVKAEYGTAAVEQTDLFAEVSRVENAVDGFQYLRVSALQADLQ